MHTPIFRLAHERLQFCICLARQARYQDLAQAKGELLLLKHKMHRERIGSRLPSREHTPSFSPSSTSQLQ